MTVKLQKTCTSGVEDVADIARCSRCGRFPAVFLPYDGGPCESPHLVCCGKQHCLSGKCGGKPSDLYHRPVLFVVDSVDTPNAQET
jgi:hypothetical protein